MKLLRGDYIYKHCQMLVWLKWTHFLVFNDVNDNHPDLGDDVYMCFLFDWSLNRNPSRTGEPYPRIAKAPSVFILIGHKSVLPDPYIPTTNHLVWDYACRLSLTATHFSIYSDFRTHKENCMTNCMWINHPLKESFNIKISTVNMWTHLS